MLTPSLDKQMSRICLSKIWHKRDHEILFFFFFSWYTAFFQDNSKDIYMVSALTELSGKETRPRGEITSPRSAQPVAEACLRPEPMPPLAGFPGGMRVVC